MKNICKRLLLKMCSWDSKKISLQKKNIFFKKDLLVAASYKKTPVLESLFNSDYYQIFKSTYYEEHLRTTASENVFMKLREINIYKEFDSTLKKKFFQHQKQVKMFVFTSWLVSHGVCIHIQYSFGGVRNKLQTLNI